MVVFVLIVVLFIMVMLFNFVLVVDSLIEISVKFVRFVVL